MWPPSSHIPRGPKDQTNIQSLQTMISGISPYIGPWSQDVKSVCLSGLLGPEFPLLEDSSPLWRLVHGVAGDRQDGTVEELDELLIFEGEL